jgi:hypothetical protein
MPLSTARVVLIVPMLAFAASSLRGQSNAGEGVLMANATAEIAPASADELLAPVTYTDDRLRSMVEELQSRSPLVRTMISTIRRSGLPLVFGTFSDFQEEMKEEYRSWDPAEKSAAGFMAPVVRQSDKFQTSLSTVKMLVGINLEALDDLFLRATLTQPQGPTSWEEIRRLETLSVLAHEIVHAYGLALADGDPRGGCADPHVDQIPSASCVMIGENLVRREIGAPADGDYGFPSLAHLSSRYADAAARRAKLQEIARFRLPNAPVLQPLPTALPPR